MTTLLVILAIVLMGAVALLAWDRDVPAVLRRRLPGRRTARGTAGDDDDDGDDGGGRAALPGGIGLVEPVASLPPVLLPEDPTAADVDAVRFGLGLRGYRMDQVDEVLDRLSAALEARDASMRLLRAELAGRDADR